MKMTERVQTIILDTTGYLVLFVQQIPGIWVWAPLMAAPVILLIAALISNLPTSMIEAYQTFIMVNEVVMGKILIILSVIIIVTSIVYLGVKKRNGLVTTGPYRFVRHPQYTGFLLLTIGLTGWSYFYITNFFGIGWLSANDTIALWYLELAIYIILSFIEDRHLLKKYGDEYASYKSTTPSFLPLLKTGKMDAAISVIIFSLILSFTIQFPLA
jgi:protein-S-isoprenylcysteine O-methyltransferase Ste14